VFAVHALIIDRLLLFDIQRAPLPRSERSGYLEEWTSGYGIKEASDYLVAKWKANPNQPIVVGTEGYFGTLPDGLEIYVNNISKIVVVGLGQPIKDIPQNLVDSAKSGNDTYLLVNSSRYSGGYPKDGLVEISTYPKAIRPNGSRDVLLFFRVLPPSNLTKK
jgi:hypothetical protein